jgi:hypothetical protein
MLDYLQRLEDGGLSLSFILFGHMCFVLGWVGSGPIRTDAEGSRNGLGSSKLMKINFV